MHDRSRSQRIGPRLRRPASTRDGPGWCHGMVTEERQRPAWWTPARWAAEVPSLLRGVRQRLHGRDLSLIAAGLTFYAGLAVVPLLVVTFALTAHLTSAQTVRELGDRLADLLPAQLGAPAAVDRLVR